MTNLQDSFVISIWNGAKQRLSVCTRKAHVGTKSPSLAYCDNLMLLTALRPSASHREDDRNWGLERE